MGSFLISLAIFAAYDHIAILAIYGHMAIRPCAKNLALWGILEKSVENVAQECWVNTVDLKSVGHSSEKWWPKIKFFLLPLWDIKHSTQLKNWPCLLDLYFGYKISLWGWLSKLKHITNKVTKNISTHKQRDCRQRTCRGVLKPTIETFSSPAIIWRCICL